jgi:hypothetical protein
VGLQVVWESVSSVFKPGMKLEVSKKFASLPTLIVGSFFCTDPDPLTVLLFSSLTIKTPTNN